MDFSEQLKAIGLPAGDIAMFDERRNWSESRIGELSNKLSIAPALGQFSGLSVFAAGSYGRGEGTRYSDIDLFFVCNDKDHSVEDPHLKSIRVLSAVMRAMEDEMDFPPPSNDGQFFKILSLANMLKHLGAAEDDHQNFFTARMLMLLEAKPVYNSSEFRRCMSCFVESYLRDYEDHAENFRPTFLVNDILRFWKTLCLNYEHRRNQENDRKKIKQKIRNYKLKFSRLMTCFSSIAVLAGLKQVAPSELVSLCMQRPVDRMLSLYDNTPNASKQIERSLRLYAEFLRKVDCPTDELEDWFNKKDNRVAAFSKANEFGEEMFQLVRVTADANDTLRYLVI